MVGRAAPYALALALWAGATPSAQAQPEECRLALLLGHDVSASVDQAEYELQRNGLIAALTAPEVQAALFSGPGLVALGIFEWSGRFQQDMVVDWRLMRDERDLAAVTGAVTARVRRSEDFPTALGYALGFAANAFDSAPPCLFRTLDIAGDGQNNDGFPPAAAFEHFPFDGITVNGLAIGGASREIDLYYEAEVIRGPGAFVEYARTHDDFANAMRRKLERELRVMILGAVDPSGR